MAGYIVIGALAAFGMLSAVWVLLGWMLPSGREGLLLYPAVAGEKVLSFAWRYLWLRGLGFLRCPMVMVDTDLADPERQWLEGHGIEICGPEELNSRLGIGAERN